MRPRSGDLTSIKIIKVSNGNYIEIISMFTRGVSGRRSFPFNGFELLDRTDDALMSLTN